MDDIESLIERAVEAVLQRSFGSRVYGVVYATVKTLDDEGCTLEYKSLSFSGAGTNARIAAAGAGDGRGVFWRPDVEDEVVVAFENGDPSFPVVIGAVWNNDQKPPSGTDTAQSNNIRALVSRKGSKITFDDQNQKLVIETGIAKIEMNGSSGEIKITTTGATPGTKITLDGVSWNHQHATGAGPSGPPVPISG